MYYFSTADQLKLLRAFDSIIENLDSKREYKQQLRSVLVGMTLNTTSSSDADLFELMMYYDEKGILNENEYLLAQLREYLDNRFDFMDRQLILKYCTFLKDIGMFFQDQSMILRLEEYFSNHYYVFELSELFQMLKLQAYCFYKPEKLPLLIADSISIRVKQ